MLFIAFAVRRMLVQDGCESLSSLPQLRDSYENTTQGGDCNIAKLRMTTRATRVSLDGYCTALVTLMTTLVQRCSAV
jgi:hypothetical protein